MSKKEKIYTVSSVDVEAEHQIETETVGSRTTLAKAAALGADYILERIIIRPDIRYALFHDIHHVDVLEEIASRSGRPRKYLEKKFAFDPSERWKMPKTVERTLREFFTEELQVSMIYHVETDTESEIGCQNYFFEIAGNDLER